MWVGPLSKSRDLPVVILCDDLDNLGDLCLLLQNLEHAPKGALVRRWAAIPPDIEAQVREAGGTTVSARNLWRFARQCMGSEVVLGGGQFVRDRTSYRALVGILVAVIAARLTGGRAVARGLGVSRMRSTGRKLLFWSILLFAQPVRLRDQTSLDNLNAWGFGLRKWVTMDLAFADSALMRRLFPRGERARQGDGRIVIAPCEDSWENRAIAGPALDALLRAATARLDVKTVRIVCHDPRAGMDQAAAARLKARYPDLTFEVVSAHSLDALAQEYREASLVLSNRLHAVIFGAFAQVPTIAFSRPSGKLVPFAEGLGIATICPDAVVGDDEAREAIEQSLAIDVAERRARLCRMSEAASLNFD